MFKRTIKRPGLFKLLAAVGLLFFANRRWNERFIEATNISAPITDNEGKKRYGRKIRVRSLFNASPDKVWQAVRTVELLQQVSAPTL